MIHQVFYKPDQRSGKALMKPTQFYTRELAEKWIREMGFEEIAFAAPSIFRS